MFRNWATPVVRRRWAAAAVLLSTINRMTGWRLSGLSGKPAARAFDRATEPKAKGPRSLR